MLIRSILAAALTVYMSSTVDAQDGSTPKAEDINIARPYIRLAVHPGHTSITGIPDDLRTAAEYNRPANVHTLPDRTAGMLTAVSVGVGIDIFKRLAVAFDAMRLDTYNAGRTTWSEIGFPSDDYIGYRYHGWDFDGVLVFTFRKPAARHVPWTPGSQNFDLKTSVHWYAKGGARFHRGSLESGTDAWNTFGRQHAIDVRGTSYVAAVGLRKDFIEIEAEVSDSVAHTSVPQTFRIGSSLRFSLFRARS